MNLTYRSFVDVEELRIGQCTIRLAHEEGKRWWMLWVHVLRDSDGMPDVFAVPVNPGGAFDESGPGGRTWALTRVSPTRWQVSPSVNVLDTTPEFDRATPGAYVPERKLAPVVGHAPTGHSLWHQSPLLVEVDEMDAWARGNPA